MVNKLDSPDICLTISNFGLLQFLIKYLLSFLEGKNQDIKSIGEIKTYVILAM